MSYSAPTVGRRAKTLRLHARMAAVAMVLTAFVSWVFLRLGLVPFAVGFGGVATISLLILWGRPNRHAALCTYHSSLTFSHTILD